jgi:hypothetical protein
LENSNTFDTRKCTIPLSALRADAPASNVYQLTQGTQLVLRIKFRNEIGWSTLSSDFIPSGVLMETVPHDPAVAPTRNDVLTLGS